MLTPAHLRDLAIIAYAFGAAAVFDGVALLLALGLGMAIFGVIAGPSHQTSAPRYQLKLRYRGHVQVLATMDDETTGLAALQTHAAQLEAEGAIGQLVLVEGAIRHPITWQVLDPGASDGDPKSVSAG